jgi:hypothetical protein
MGRRVRTSAAHPSRSADIARHWPVMWRPARCVMRCRQRQGPQAGSVRRAGPLPEQRAPRTAPTMSWNRPGTGCSIPPLVTAGCKRPQLHDFISVAGIRRNRARSLLGIIARLRGDQVCFARRYLSIALVVRQRSACPVMSRSRTLVASAHHALVSVGVIRAGVARPYVGRVAFSAGYTECCRCDKSHPIRSFRAAQVNSSRRSPTGRREHQRVDPDHRGTSPPFTRSRRQGSTCRCRFHRRSCGCRRRRQAG